MHELYVINLYLIFAINRNQKSLMLWNGEPPIQHFQTFSYSDTSFFNRKILFHIHLPNDTGYRGDILYEIILLFRSIKNLI